MNHDRIKLLEKFIEDEPDDPFNSYALAMEYYEWEAQKALSILSSLQQKQASYLPTYFKLAHLLWEEEEWDKADTIFMKGIALAEEQNDQKALAELKSTYQNFLFEKE